MPVKDANDACRPLVLFKSEFSDISGLLGRDDTEDDVDDSLRGWGSQLSLGGRKTVGRFGGEYESLRSNSGKEPCRMPKNWLLSKGLGISLCGCSGVTGGEKGGVFVVIPLTQDPASALALQLLLTLARVAAASESLSFSA